MRENIEAIRTLTWMKLQIGVSQAEIDALDHACLTLAECDDREHRDKLEAIDCLHDRLQQGKRSKL